MRAILIVVMIVAGCVGDKPTPTGATCPDPNSPALTWDNFGYDFMCHYCTNCHDSSLTLNQRNGAPLFHDLDTLVGVMQVHLHTDEQAGWGPNAHNNFMPGGGTNGRCPSTRGGALDHDCPQPTAQERENLATYVACELERPQDYQGSDAGVSDHCSHYTGPPP
jgi:hypothetical protein